MNIRLLFIIIYSLCLFGSCSYQTKSVKGNAYDRLWKECHLQNIIPGELFNIAMTGYDQIDTLRNKKVITIIDFTKPSTQERFFVIDLDSKALIYKTYVAHGRNSGENYAKSFSNFSGSLESSLGFFVTAETYTGEHGYSLKLDGLEKGINDNARERSIVIHGADYVSRDYVDKYGRLGRSWGCPALPVELTKEIIDTIAHGSCLFIYADDRKYLRESTLINGKNNDSAGEGTMQKKDSSNS